jgi:hypothetical protein
MQGVVWVLAWVLAVSTAFAPFEVRVKEYMQLRRHAEPLPALKQSATPEEIAAYEKALAAAIRKARSNARQGQIFVAEAAPEFVRVVRAVAPGPADSTWRAIMETNPVEGTVGVNAAYPSRLPVSTVPPSLLLKLPQLPTTLQYGFVGSNLILRDTKANLILDYLPNVLPTR